MGEDRGREPPALLPGMSSSPARPAGLFLAASILAFCPALGAAMSAPAVAAATPDQQAAPRPPREVAKEIAKLGKDAPVSLYAEIANKNNIGDGDDFGTGTSGPGPAGPTPPPVAERVVVDQHGNPVPPAAPEPPIPADAPPPRRRTPRWR